MIRKSRFSDENEAKKKKKKSFIFHKNQKIFWECWFKVGM